MSKPVRYLTARRGKDGAFRYYWQPSTPLRANGWKVERIPPNWQDYSTPEALHSAALLRAGELNDILDRACNRLGQQSPKAPAPKQYRQETNTTQAMKRRGDPEFGGRQYLYVIGGQRGLQKVGISRCPERRRRALETSSGRPLHIWALYGGRMTFANLLERDVHARLAAFRRQGEWFDCSLDVALSALGAAILDLHKARCASDENK